MTKLPIAVLTACLAFAEDAKKPAVPPAPKQLSELHGERVDRLLAQQKSLEARKQLAIEQKFGDAMRAHIKELFGEEEQTLQRESNDFVTRVCDAAGYKVAECRIDPAGKTVSFATPPTEARSAPAAVKSDAKPSK